MERWKRPGVRQRGRLPSHEPFTPPGCLPRTPAGALLYSLTNAIATGQAHARAYTPGPWTCRPASNRRIHRRHQMCRYGLHPLPQRSGPRIRQSQLHTARVPTPHGHLDCDGINPTSTVVPQGHSWGKTCKFGTVVTEQHPSIAKQNRNYPLKPRPRQQGLSRLHPQERARSVIRLMRQHEATADLLTTCP